MSEQRLIDANAIRETVSLLMPSPSTPDYCGRYDQEIMAAQEMCVDIMNAIDAAPTVPTAVLPCAVGDTVWGKISEHAFKVQRIELWPDARLVFRCGNDGTEDYMCFFADEIGETVLIGAEAEAAIRSKEGAENHE